MMVRVHMSRVSSGHRRGTVHLQVRRQGRSCPWKDRPLYQTTEGRSDVSAS